MSEQKMTVEKLKKELTKIKKSAKAKAKKTDEFVKAKPYHAIGAAAGIAAVGGLLVGLLLRRRKSE